MRKIFALWLAFMIIMHHSPSFSQTQEAALAKAFIQANHLTIALESENHIKISDTDNRNNLALAFAGNPKGFIVVSLHETLPPVIAYSENGSFEAGSPLESFIRADLETRIASREMFDPSVKAALQAWRMALLSEALPESEIIYWPPQSYSSTGGWTKTAWSQNAPYNNYCPIKLSTGQRSVAGCPAIAMAQILLFHQTTNQTRFNITDRYYHNYTQQFWIDDAWQTYAFLSFETLNIHLDTIDAKFGSDRELDNDDKAALSLAAGFACKSVYDPGGSGTFGVIQAYNAFQKFGFIESVLFNSSYTNEEINDKMIEDIRKARPVHLATVDPAWQYGHNVVADGYRSDGFFRLNMGWGGSYDSWYHLPEGFPLGLTVYEGIVANIKAEPNQTEYEITLFAEPDDANPLLIGEGTYPDGFPIPISAEYLDGFLFIGWDGSDDDLTLVDDPLKRTTFITMPEWDVTLTAVYNKYYDVSFQIYGEGMNPVQGALISIENVPGLFVTNAEGTASAELTNGIYSFTVEADGYLSYNGSFEVDDETVFVEVNLSQVGISREESFAARIFPVPFNNFLCIDNSGLQRIYKASLVTLGGKLILKKELDVESRYCLPVSNVAPGVYLLILEDKDGNTFVKKVLKVL